MHQKYVFLYLVYMYLCLFVPSLQSDRAAGPGAAGFVESIGVGCVKHCATSSVFDHFLFQLLPLVSYAMLSIGA